MVLFKCTVVVLLWALISTAFPNSLAFSPFILCPKSARRRRSSLSPHSIHRRRHDSNDIDEGHNFNRGLSLKSEKKNLSASQQEQRAEEQRRLERKTDVVIGRTSAKPQAQDYAIDSKTTEQEWMRQASNLDQQVYRETERGMKSLKMLQVEEATEAFDRVFELRPDAYLWQAGIAKFYLGDLEGAADIFARSVRYFEDRFLSPASEERIWRDACELKLASTMDKTEIKNARENGGVSSMISQIPERQEPDNDEPLPAETRKVLRIARDLFAATVEGNYANEVLARAKLRAICGSSSNDKPRLDPKMWRLSAWFYLGLHYDVVGDEEASKECMKNALRLCPSSGNGDDIIHTLPLLHMARRDLFDDDEFVPVNAIDDDSEGASFEDTVSNANSRIADDSVFITSLRNSISKMKYVDLQSALKTRGLKFHDSKEALQEKLFRSLVEESGLDEYQ